MPSVEKTTEPLMYHQSLLLCLLNISKEILTQQGCQLKYIIYILNATLFQTN